METINFFTDTVLGFIGGLSFGFVIFVIIGLFSTKKIQDASKRNYKGGSGKA